MAPVTALGMAAVFALYYSMGGNLPGESGALGDLLCKGHERFCGDAASSGPDTRSGEYQTASISFSLCRGKKYNCVIDGDTFYLGRERIRISDIDTPETNPPRCEYEADLGARATTRLLDLLNGGEFHVRVDPLRPRDKYGRTLAVVERNGQSLGGVLVSEGLARPWTGRRQPWC